MDLLLPTIWDELRRRVHVTSLDAVQIVPAQLGTWAGAIGAAAYAALMWSAVRWARGRPGVVAGEQARGEAQLTHSG